MGVVVKVLRTLVPVPQTFFVVLGMEKPTTNAIGDNGLRAVRTVALGCNHNKNPFSELTANSVHMQSVGGPLKPGEESLSRRRVNFLARG